MLRKPFTVERYTSIIPGSASLWGRRGHVLTKECGNISQADPSYKDGSEEYTLRLLANYAGMFGHGLEVLHIVKENEENHVLQAYWEKVMQKLNARVRSEIASVHE